ncbi:PEP-CTERM sorting domain-containing protein [Roseiconus lacunae]|uniref:PEP-CTERM sorting domain-containing protein n=1 Tax=Roseiconus lacunae TaxID=2605694 RepID=A0ABT7PDJ8_9BACT|nr:PEP-CTERM sorting domain-containing protein [Roseiconus lacunae]MCD0459879.1 PEP-CTERM sorting domain-containing protein [Roseiconus lacunae]MDM4014578.1 PEP-CTERM sorting domain-containing protein [Roseiconus lacunae]
MKIALMTCLLVGMASLSHAAVVLQGTDVTFNGAGVYNFEFTATAVGQTETISGFTMPLQLANGATFQSEIPDSSLSDIEFTPNSLLETKGASSDFTLSGFGFSITSVDANGSPLVLNDGESAVLFTIPMNVFVPGEVLVENTALAQLFALTGASSVQLSPEFSAAAQAVPEPASIAGAGSLCLLGGGMIYRRRRRI